MMTIHFLTRPLPRSAVVPSLFPDTMDALLTQRREAGDMAYRIIHATSLPYALAARQGDWSRRLSAKIAQVAK